MFRWFTIHSEICSMHIVIAAATPAEIKPFVDWHAVAGNKSGHKIEVLITGVGVLTATFSLTRKMLERRPDMVVQAGIAGSFDDALPIGAVVLVNEEIVGDYGVSEKGVWKDIFDLGLMGKDEFPLNNGKLPNPYAKKLNKFGWPSVSSLTVNEIITLPEKHSEIIRKYNPRIESMEGAALHYCCLQLNIPFLQLRGISNKATERDKKNWKIVESIAAVNKALITFIEDTAV